MRDVSLEDLVALAVPIATDELNDLLGGVVYADIKIEATQFFGAPRELFGETVVHDLDAMHAGLTERLGEHSFAARVNRMRQATLAGSEETVFGESAFKISGDFSHGWSVDVGDAVGTVGFAGSPTLEAIVIAPYEGNLEAAWRAPLKAVSEARGFVLPRDVEDVREMAPGSSVTLRGAGSLGFNLGIGLPISLAAVGDFLTVVARISAGARVGLTGTLDVQLVRGDDDDAWVDVGVQRYSTRHFELAVRSGWGVEGLPTLDLEVGPLHLDLADIAERALEKHLNEKLALLSGSASQGVQRSRVTVARFRLDLTRDTKDVRQALSQAMRGDVRLAQALANRPGSGVTQALDITRDARSESRYVGFRFLSMAFFARSNDTVGAVHIEEGDEHQTLLFSELEREGGLFWNAKTSAWRQVTSLRSENNKLIDAQLNARLTLRERDRFLTKDQILDHVDPLLAYFIGYDHTFTRIGESADALFRFADHHCPIPDDDNGRPSRAERDAYDMCVAGLEQHPDYQALVTEARERFEDASTHSLAMGFDPAYDTALEVAQKLFELRLGVSGIHDKPNVGLNGPKGGLVAQVRFSNGALRDILAEGNVGAFEAIIGETLSQMHANRDHVQSKKTEQMADFVRGRKSAVAPMLRVFEKTSARFAQLERVAALDVGGERLGTHSALMTVPVDNPQDAELATVAEHQGRVIADLFPELVDAAGWLREPDAFVVGYALLQLTHPSQIELVTTYNFGDHDGGYDRYDTRVYARGTEPFIDAGLFDLDELLGSE